MTPQQVLSASDSSNGGASDAEDDAETLAEVRTSSSKTSTHSSTHFTRRKAVRERAAPKQSSERRGSVDRIMARMAKQSQKFWNRHPAQYNWNLDEHEESVVRALMHGASPARHLVWAQAGYDTAGAARDGCA